MKPFVGRDLEVSLLRTCVREAVAGRGRFAWISGEPGIGKTRLADELSASAASEGLAVIWGRSWEGEGTPAYWPWMQALRRLSSDPLFSALVAEATARRPELRALAAAPAAEGPVADPEQARFRLFDGVARLLQAASEVKPLLVVLDDLHAADHSSLLLLRFVARDLQGTRISLVATARDTRIPEVAAAAKEALHVPLGRLAVADVRRWLEQGSPRFLDRIDAVFATSEGNPLFVEELLTTLVRRHGALSTPMPEGIRAAIRGHLGSLSEETLRTLECVAVFGREVPARALVAFEGALDPSEALAAGVLVADGEVLRFSHVLIRDELYAGIDAARRAELHRRAARWLARTEGPLVVAHHVLLGATARDLDEAVRSIAAAMREASLRFAFEDAAILGERALATLEPLGLGHLHRCALLIDVGQAWILSGAGEKGQRLTREAADLAAAEGRSDLLARAALIHAAEEVVIRREPVVALLLRALDALGDGDSPMRAEVMARLSIAMIPAAPDEGDTPLRLRKEALAMARRLGTDAPLFTALRFAAVSGSEDLSAEERLAQNHETIRLAEKLGELPRIVPLLGWVLACRLELGDRGGAHVELARAQEILAGFPQPHYQWRGPLLAASLASLEGRFDDADAHMRVALELGERHRLFEALLHVAIYRTTHQLIRGDAEGFGPFDALVQRTYAGNGPLAAVFGSLADVVMGRADQARAALLPLPTMPNVSTIPGLAALGWVVVGARIEELAPFFYEVALRTLTRVPLMFGPSAMSCTGPVELIAGRLALMLGREDAAEAHLHAARARCEQLGAVPLLAQTELALASLFSAKDRTRASAHAETAERLARSLGMDAVADRAAALRGPPPIRSSVVPTTVARLEARGELWAIIVGAKEVLLRDTKGIGFLRALLDEPHRSVHVLELAGVDERGDAGPMLDARAKADYRARADALRQDLDEATANADRGRIERARDELEQLSDELARAVGLGGRDRRAASVAERARVNVQRRLKDVIRRVEEQDPELGRHLEASVRTGVFCVYAPTWPT